MKNLALLLLTIPALLASAADTKRTYDDLAADRSHTDTERLRQLFDLEWERGLQESPEFATSIGDPRFDNHWSDVSQKAIKRRKAELQFPLAAMKSIDRSKLSEADRLNCDLFLRALELRIEGSRFDYQFLAISQLGGVQQNVSQQLAKMPTNSIKGYDNILARLRALPVLVEQNVALLERGLAAGVTQPRITLRDVPQQILNVIPDDPLKSPLLKPFKEFPPTIPESERERLRAEAVETYKSRIVPAYEALHTFMVKKYIPGARESIACGDLPNGTAWYALSVRASTTTAMTPKEIHELGLREVERIRGEMKKVAAETKFEGSLEEFTEFLRTDPQFYYSKPDDLVSGYREIAKRIDPELPRQFGKLPRMTYGVKAIPDHAAQSFPTAYYDVGSEKAGRPGWFMANTSNLAGRPKWQMECLTLHEAVPGHHLQLSLAREMDEVPQFRKYSHYTAFSEGWGLYAESLGGELGLYKDPYSRYGALTFEMWRSVRLVVDTGMHAFGWSRDKALRFMIDNTGKDERDATVEIDRYIVWPGQALAYKIGQLKIRALRDDATRELGAKFDIRAFHDALLANGAVPLDVLEARMKDWIAAQKANATSER
jgi:uncharacterized protein (DUF885 family)